MPSADNPLMQKQIGSRAADEFTALHDAAIMEQRWVIEGNYSRLLTQRLERATGFILLDAPATISLYRADPDSASTRLALRCR